MSKFRWNKNQVVTTNPDLDFVKTKIKDAARSSFPFYNANVPQNLSDKELEALNRLSKNKNLVVHKVDNGNSLALVDKDNYQTYGKYSQRQH